jgi:fructoselysine-6-P-deglycase FrlB-like protein
MAILNEERSRQRRDACDSFAQAIEPAGRIAHRLRSAGRLALIGMGGSHFINRIVEPMYRIAGLDATAHTASEMAQAGLPQGERATIITSQSGASSEIQALLTAPRHLSDCFGLTLETDSPLTRSMPCLVGVGGSERSFAAARSAVVTLALHGAILDCLGLSQTEAMRWVATSRDAAVERAADSLLSVSNATVVASTILRGVGESLGLTLMELSRMPVQALELAQMRHGPMEALGDGSGVVAIVEEKESVAFAEIEAACAASRSKLVVFDMGGRMRDGHAMRVPIPAGPGIATAIDIVIAGQSLAIHMASQRFSDAGSPRLTRKVM